MTKDVVVASEQLDIEKLVAAIREIAGEHLDRVILYGSFAWGNWDADRSDIDVAVLLRFPPRSDEMIEDFMQYRNRIDAASKIKDAISVMAKESVFGTLSPRINFCVRDAQGVEYLRNFKPCMESKLLSRGEFLWSSPVQRDYQAASEDDARHAVISRGMTAATRILNDARYELAFNNTRKFCLPNFNTLDGIEWGNNCADSHTAACMCLRALLYAHNIDPSDNSMRWRVAELIAKLITVMPDTTRLLKRAKSLPDRFAQSWGNLDANRVEARNAIAAAIRIHTFHRRNSTPFWTLHSAEKCRAYALKTAEKINDGGAT